MEKIVGGRVWLITAVNVKRTSERMFFCSKLCKPVWRLGSDAINNRSNFREERIIVQKIAATFREERIITRKFGVNHQAKRIIIRKIVRIKTIGVMKMQGNFVEISFEAKFLRKATKSQEFCRNSFALLLYNTVSSSIVALSFIAAGMFCRLQVEI